MELFDANSFINILCYVQRMFFKSLNSLVKDFDRCDGELIFSFSMTLRNN